MKMTMNFEDFCNGFPKTYKNNFSYEGKKTLFNYLEEYEDNTGEEVEYDPIALCCEYTEFENLKELQTSYPDIKTMEELEEKTQVVLIPNSDKFIIQQY